MQLIAKKPTATFVTMTRELVDALLVLNTKNRCQRPEIIKTYRRAMDNNFWVTTNQGIGVAASGFLVDGQHRLEAAKREGLSVPYRVIDGLTEDDIVLINADNKKWNMSNYVHFWAQKGVSDYVFLEQFMDKHQLTARAAARIIGSQDRSANGIGGQQPLLKAGKFKLSHAKVERAEELIRRLHQIRQYCRFKVFANTIFIGAIEKMIADGVFMELLEKVKVSGNLLEKQSTVVAYLRDFETYVNKGKHKSKNYTRLF